MDSRVLADAPPQRIYVRLPSWVGDVVMATPALRALRDRFPSAEIWAEGRRPVAPLVSGLRSVNRVLDDPGRKVRDLWEHGRELRRIGFEWAVLLPDSLRTAVAPWFAGIPVRAGYARDPLRRRLLTHALDVPSEEGRRIPVSMVERYQRIVRELGCADPEPGLDLPISGEARTRVRRRLAGLGISDDVPRVVISPGAAFGSSKLWPVEHFVAAARGLEERLGLRVVLAPGPGEESIARQIQAGLGGRALVLDEPVTTLSELAALISGADLVLSNDTGPRHMAVALGVPVITVMGPTDPRHTAHLLERQVVLREDVECSPCHQKVCPIDHRCMRRLTPERVVEAAAELLE